MKLTKTVKICYLFGMCITVVGLFLITYRVSLAEWRYGDSLRDMTYEDWTPEVQDMAKIMVYPYQILGVIVFFFGVIAFVLLPTVVSQIAHEVTETNKSQSN